MTGGGPAPGNAVRIVVADEAKTGKSSLIVSAAAENFPNNVPPVLPPTRLPEDLYPDRVPATIIDTSSRNGRNLVARENAERRLREVVELLNLIANA